MPGGGFLASYSELTQKFTTSGLVVGVVYCLFHFAGAKFLWVQLITNLTAFVIIIMGGGGGGGGGGMEVRLLL